VVEDVLHINYVSVSWPGCCGQGVADVGLVTGPTRCVSSAAAGRGYVESFHLVFFCFNEVLSWNSFDWGLLCIWNPCISDTQTLVSD